MSGAPCPVPRSKRHIDRLDVDKDGTVTLEEFISSFREQHKVEEDDTEPEDKKSSGSEAEISNDTEQAISK